MQRLFWAKMILSITAENESDGFLDCFVEKLDEVERIKNGVIEVLCKEDCLFEIDKRKYIITVRGMKMLEGINALSTKKYAELLEGDEFPIESFLKMD